MIRRNEYVCQFALGLTVAAIWLLPLRMGGATRTSEAAAHDVHSDKAEERNANETESKTRGVALGEYRIRAYYPVEAKRSTVAFTLYGIVASENAGEFERLLENRRQKVRDQVIVATRLVPLADFDDPDLKQFRRRILLRLRRALPELEMDDIYVSDFQLEVREI